MKFLIHVLNALSAFVPDFLVLSLIAAEFISLYSIVKACGLKLGAEIALGLAYLAAVASDIANELLQPAPWPVDLLTQQAAHNPSRLLSREQHYKSREARALVIRP